MIDWKPNKVLVVGLGYIGLPTAAILANQGISVVGLETKDTIIETINNGEVHIFEPNLDQLVKSAVSSGKLRATRDPEHADVYLIAVPTPFKEGHEPDLSYVQSAVQAITPVLKKGDLIILESTSSVGTTEMIQDQIQKTRQDLSFSKDSSDVFIAYCPERVLPGKILEEIIQNDRVIGGLNDTSSQKAKAFYKGFVKGNCLLTNSRTAEMTKLVENSYRDVNIAFANELSILCDQLKINVWELISLANKHPRVNILNPGPGVGGHCISVDPWFLVHQLPQHTKMIRTAREVNDYKPNHVLNQVQKASEKFKAPTIAFLGLSFKPNIDDLRGSPALKIVEDFARLNLGNLLAVEPYIESLPMQLLDLKVAKAPTEEALEKADILVLLVDHDEFKEISPRALSSKVIIDTRGIWS